MERCYLKYITEWTQGFDGEVLKDYMRTISKNCVTEKRGFVFLVNFFSPHFGKFIQIVNIIFDNSRQWDTTEKHII